MNSEPLASNHNYRFLQGGGEMGDRIRSHDWAQTTLGTPDRWSPSLRSALSICLNSRFPIAIYWGREFILLYNDAWRPIVGDKHAWALGYPAREVWAEIWEDIGAELAGVLATGEGTFHQDDLLSMHRYGYTEECFFEYTFNPIQGESGVEGVFNVVSETTYRVLNDRRSRLLRDVAGQTGSIQTVTAACETMLATFVAAPLDIPLALLYTIDADGKSARLFDPERVDRSLCPAVVDLEADDSTGWSIALAARTGRSQIIDSLPERFGLIPGSPWPEPPQEAMVLPIVTPGQNGIAGVLVAVASPRRRLDDNYCDFFSQIAGQMGIAIANAQAYEAERHRAEALAELDRAKTAFFSNVSHEFRTPLTLMLAPAEDALGDEIHPLPPPQQERIALIQRNGQRLLKLVNTLLDFSRIEAGRVQACYEPTDVAAFTAELASVFRSAIERADLRLVVDCPTLSESVYIDREMWEKIVLNLLSNAFKFTFTGEIGVRLRQQDRSAVLEVSDTGIGIPPAEIPHLFDRFHRVKGARGRSFEGSGIGLSLVWELVKLHQGTIEVSSVEGEGTRMTVAIPLGTAHLPVARIGNSSTLTSTAVSADTYMSEVLSWLPENEPAERLMREGELCSPSLGAKNISSARIILADDNADMRDYVKRLLSQRYEVTAVADGQEVLAAVRDRVPDLILTDVMMPGLDGFGLLQALRAEPQTREIPIIMLSARAGEEARVEGLAAGADDYLVKPFSARELLARVEASLKLAKVRQETATQERQLRTEAETARQQVDRVLSSIKDGFYVLDREWRFTYVSDRYCQMVAMSPAELIGNNVWELFPAAVDTAAYYCFQQAIADRLPMQFDYLYQPWQVWHEHRLYPSPEGLTVFLTDITERKQLELLQVEQNRLLEAIATGTPLTDCLSAICEAIGRLNPHVRACFRLMDERREFFALSIAPEMPPSFGRELQRVPLADPNFGTCGEAVVSNRAVTCADIAKDPQRSTAWQELCLEHGIAACHSQPAFCADNSPFGSLMLCFDTARVPTEWEYQLAIFGSKIASIASDRDLLLHQERSARQSAEAAEAKLQDILTSIREDFISIDRQWRIAYLNAAAAATLRLPQSQLIGRNVRELFPILVGTEVEARLQQVMNERTPVQFEYYYAFWQQWYEHRAYPTAEGIVVLSNDITDRKRLEAELRQKNAILDVVNQSAPTPIFVKNWQGQIIYANPATLEVLGKTAEEVIGRTDRDLYPADAERVMANDRRIMESGQTEVVEESPDGIRTFLGMKAPYRNEAGEVIGLVGIANDITERVQLEGERERILQQERAARQTADRANRIKDEFLAVLSHELRSPLHPILGWIALLRSGKLDAVKSQQALATIERNAQLQSQLIEDLLDISRILQGKLSLSASAVDLAAICRAALETVSLAATAKSIDLQLTIAAGENSPYLVTGDPTRLQQVCWNLLANAVKFTPANGCVRLELTSVDDRAQITVSDTGKGIAADFLPNVFDYFRQEDGAITRKFGGLGLGLAIVRQIVELHGGTVRASSAGEGLGATFSVRLPLLPQPPVLESAADAPRADLDLNGARILVVDDDNDSIEFIAFAIEQAGAIVTTANTATAAIDLLNHSHFDLLLSDIGMPEFDGYSLIRQVRSLPPSQNGLIPAIALTAYAGDFDRQQALAAGFQHHLAKPLEPDELIQAIADRIG